jgi:simple sugar transport system ATP-binding protein
VRSASTASPPPPDAARALAQPGCLRLPEVDRDPTLSIAENVVLNAYRRSATGHRLGTARREASELLAGGARARRAPPGLDAHRRPAAARRDRTCAPLGSRFIILDEPTAQLEAGEIARLFEHLARLRAGGVSCLYISHHLDEVFELCQTVTVLRDGRLVDTSPVAETTKDELVHAMVGAAGATGRAGGRRPAAAAAGATPRLDVRGLTVGRCRRQLLDPGRRAVGPPAFRPGSEVADSIVGMLEPGRGSVPSTAGHSAQAACTARSRTASVGRRTATRGCRPTWRSTRTDHVDARPAGPAASSRRVSARPARPG